MIRISPRQSQLTNHWGTTTGNRACWSMDRKSAVAHSSMPAACGRHAVAKRRRGLHAHRRQITQQLAAASMATPVAAVACRNGRVGRLVGQKRFVVLAHDQQSCHARRSSPLDPVSAKGQRRRPQVHLPTGAAAARGWPWNNMTNSATEIRMVTAGISQKVRQSVIRSALPVAGIDHLARQPLIEPARGFGAEIHAQAVSDDAEQALCAGGDGFGSGLIDMDEAGGKEIVEAEAVHGDARERPAASGLPKAKKPKRTPQAAMPMASTHFMPKWSSDQPTVNITPSSTHWPMVVSGPTLSLRTPTFFSKKMATKPK